MVHYAVVFEVKEDKVAGGGDVIEGSPVKVKLRQVCYPFGAICLKGEIRYICIMYAEGDKHRAPVAIAVAVPVAVACVAAGHKAVFGDIIVFGALAVSQLALRDRKNILGGSAAEFNTPEACFPLGRGLHIGGRIGIALFYMAVLLDLTVQHPCAVAAVAVAMLRALLKRAGEAVIRRETEAVLSMYMLIGLHLGADKAGFAFALLQTAVRNRCEAKLVVDMAFLFGRFAHKFTAYIGIAFLAVAVATDDDIAVLAMHMLTQFGKRAHKCAFPVEVKLIGAEFHIAAVSVDMLCVTAERIRLCGYCRDDKGVSGDEYHNRTQCRYDFFPCFTAFALMFILFRLLHDVFIHLLAPPSDEK